VYNEVDRVCFHLDTKLTVFEWHSASTRVTFQMEIIFHNEDDMTKVARMNIRFDTEIFPAYHAISRKELYAVMLKFKKAESGPKEQVKVQKLVVSNGFLISI